MNKPVLVVMAAGMGSRYGGLKQIDPISSDGRIIMDFSISDAVLAGFDEVIFIIKEELLDIFEETIGSRSKSQIKVSYAFQSLSKYTNNSIDLNRTKPLGTGHAILCAKDAINNRSFVVINADDFYGRQSFEIIYNFLENSSSNSEFAMVAFNIENTVTENGYVSRGLCKVDSNNKLTEIIETLKIEVLADKTIASLTSTGQTNIPFKTPVSMNMFGFTPKYLDALELDFNNFLKNDLPKDPLKAEFFAPKVVNDLINSNEVSVRVLNTDSVWYGITYKEDKAIITDFISNMIEKGIY